MFTGIIEDLGKVSQLDSDKDNLHITIISQISKELKIDQSVSHNGVCLTVVKANTSSHTVTAIKETLTKSSLGSLQVGDVVNLERAMKMNARLDGHIVQGHVDQTAVCKDIVNENGSWLFYFEYEPNGENITIEKGSITVNGVSLTVIGSKPNGFSVAIIPYTYENTNFRAINIGDTVNLEFDVIGKYVKKLYDVSHSS